MKLPVPFKWHHCPSAADLLTRGIFSQQLILSTLWKHGPTWLTSKPLWPSQPLNEPPPPDILAVLSTEEATSDTPNTYQRNAATNVGLHKIITLSDYSCLTRLQRVTAYVLRFINNCRHPQTPVL